MIIALVLTVGFISFQSLESAVINSEINDMQTTVVSKADAVNQLHLKTSKEMTLAVHQLDLLPTLRKVVSMNMNMNMNMTNKNMNMTNNDMNMNTEMNISDQWIKDFQSVFDVPATCYLHTKDSSMYQQIVSEEQLAFPTGYGNVDIEPPHLSPHTQIPVIGYLAKIKQNGVDSAIFHCEIPFTIFNDIVKTNSGTMSIVDSSGKTISSSGQTILKDPTTITLGNPDLNIINTSENGFGTYVKNGETNYVVFKQLHTFGWLLVYEKPYSSLLSGNTSLSQLEENIFIAAISVGVAGFVIVLLLSSKISRPITQLANACRSQDVSNLKKIEVLPSKDEVWDVTNAVNEMISKINTLEKQKEEFTSMIAHELKTPLVPILGWCGSLKNSKIMGGVTLTERQFSGVDAIERNAMRLKQLVGDIMDVHKLDLQKMKFEYGDINVTEFMSFMYSKLQGMMKPKEIQFTNSTINDSMVIKSDKNRLEQVMTNLILNAVDFVRADGVIKIDARDNGDGSILFSVKDNGIGIQKEKQQYLFKKFYQADTSRTRIHGGTGLGLAVSKGIIEAMGGTMWFESEEGKGSIFYFTIPRKIIR